MKKIFLLCIAIASLALATESNAQFSAGLRLGFNASKFSGTMPVTNEKLQFVPGVHIGPYFRMAFKEKYRVQTEVLFSTKGSSYLGFQGLDTERYYNIPFYLDIPVLFNYNPVAGLYVEAGVQPSFALTQLNFSANTEAEFDKGNLKTFDFAPVVGVGYEFSKVSLGLRGAFGVTNIYPPVSLLLWNYTPTNKNVSLMATFGFKF